MLLSVVLDAVPDGMKRAPASVQADIEQKWRQDERHWVFVGRCSRSANVSKSIADDSKVATHIHKYVIVFIVQQLFLVTWIDSRGG